MRCQKHINDATRAPARQTPARARFLPAQQSRPRGDRLTADAGWIGEPICWFGRGSLASVAPLCRPIGSPFHLPRPQRQLAEGVAPPGAHAIVRKIPLLLSGSTSRRCVLVGHASRCALGPRGRFFRISVGGEGGGSLRGRMEIRKIPRRGRGCLRGNAEIGCRQPYLRRKVERRLSVLAQEPIAASRVRFHYASQLFGATVYLICLRFAQPVADTRSGTENTFRPSFSAA